MNPLQSAIDHVPKKDSLVSSVGFHNLSRQISNTSSVKSQSSRASLSRLFSRDLSHQLVPSTKHRRGSPHVSNTSNVNQRSQFFISRGFLKSKSSSQDNQVQQSRLSISSQLTGGHTDYLGDDIPDVFQSEGFSSNDFKDRGLLNQQPSSSRLEKSSISGIKSSAQKNMKLSGVSLSSQNSNSLIFNAKAASSFYFTQTDLSEEAVKPNLESGRLHELHRKYLAPAEQFVQGRLQKQPTEGDIVVGSTQEDGLKSETLSRGTDIEVIFVRLFEVMSPILCMPTDGFFEPEHMHVVLDSRVDKLMHSLENELMTYIVKNTNRSSNKEVFRKLDLKAIPFLQSHSHSNINHELIEANLEEFLKKLDAFCSQVLTTLAEDLNIGTGQFAQIQVRQRSLSNIDTPNNVDIDKYLTSWVQIIKGWNIFNTKIRYTLLNCFHYIEKDLNHVQEQHPKYRTNPKFRLDKLLNSIFKTQFIIPLLKHRQREFEKQKRGHAYVVTDFLEMERTMLLKDDRRLLKSLQNIFGIIATRTRVLYNSQDDNSYNDLLFHDFDLVLTGLTRPLH